MEARENDVDKVSVLSYETRHENPNDKEGQEEETDGDSPPVPPPYNKPPALSDISVSTTSMPMAVLTQWNSVCLTHLTHLLASLIFVT